MLLRYALLLCALTFLIAPGAVAQHGASPSLEPFDDPHDLRPTPYEKTASALATTRVLDVRHGYSWQAATESWGEPTSRDTPTYDASGWEVERLQETRSAGSDWSPSRRTVFTRDALGRVLEEYVEVRSGSSLIPSTRDTRGYHEDTDLMASHRVERWTEATGWYLSSIHEITRDAEERVLRQLWVSYNAAGEVQSSYDSRRTLDDSGRLLELEIFRMQDGEWQPYERWRRIHGDPGEPTVTLIETMTPDGTWSPHRRETLTYTPEGVFISSFAEETQDAGATWAPVFRFADAYDNVGNRTEQKQEHWNAFTEAWITTGWFQWTYDQRGLRTFEDVRARNLTTGALFLHYTNAYTYDQEGDLVEHVRQQRTQEAVPLQNQTRQTFSYRSLQVSTEAGPAGLALSLETFPNPTSGRATVRFEVTAHTPVEVSVYDLLGRRVATLAEGEHPSGSHALPFDAGALAAGTYIVRLEAGASVLTRRLTVLR